ncbi:MAG: hypothetical protein ACXVPX_06535 [Actinomycetota bacterium]
MAVLTNTRHVRRWSVRCTVDGRETRFEAATQDEALDVAHRFTKAFGAAATAHIIGTDRITTRS